MLYSSCFWFNWNLASRRFLESKYLLQKIWKTFTAWKVSVFGVFLVFIFPHSDWIQRDTEYLTFYAVFVLSFFNLISNLSGKFFGQYSLLFRHNKIFEETRISKVISQTEKYFPKLLISIDLACPKIKFLLNLQALSSFLENPPSLRFFALDFRWPSLPFRVLSCTPGLIDWNFYIYIYNSEVLLVCF